MKKIYLLLLLVFTGFCAIAKPVDKNTAMLVGKNYLLSMTGNGLRDVSSLQLAYTSATRAISSSAQLLQDSTVFFYVFNLGRNKGFIIVAGDDVATPVLGYALEGDFDGANIPISVAKWLGGYKNQIQYLLATNIKADSIAQNLWIKLKGPVQSTPASLNEGLVAPLVQTKWNQLPYYNDLCPGGSVTGCVATATAQVMKYWNYPAQGAGFHSYNSAKYGTLSANFGNTTYQWSSMPNSISGPNTAIATLMYHLGVAVNMDYSPLESSAYVIAQTNPDCAENALKNYFGYTGAKGIFRSSYTDAAWITLIEGEITAGRPVIYDGFGSGGGHCFVADGYDASNYIHFNWGWGGAYDGYFTINALNPEGLGTGGGSGGFNSGQQAVIGIQPPGSAQTYNLQLYAAVAPSAASIGYANAFSVHTDVANFGSNGFTGDFCAALFDKTGIFVNYIEIKSGWSLAPLTHYSSGITFSTTGLFGTLPGDYTIGIFYKPTGGNWVGFANTGSFINFIPLKVVNSNSIQLYKTIDPSPGPYIKGQPASVNFNIVNTGTTTFKGIYYATLYNLDGSFAQQIGQISEVNGLQPGYHYVSPYITLNTGVLTVNPGTYLLAITHQPTGGAVLLTGSGNFLNPIKVIVQKEGLNPDAYEVNNTAATAYALPVAFTNNAATTGTPGANLHISSDEDYYKVVLPAGYKYVVTPRLNDAGNSADGKVYTLDGVYSYSLDGGNSWSDTYDNVFPGGLTINGGGTVIFHVAPGFAGFTGTYLLNMGITRQSIAPTITSFTPASASEYKTVTITGINFTGATAVSFGGVQAASFTVVSATSITAVIAAGSVSGSVYVTTPYGTASLAGFTFLPPPVVTSFTPAAAGGNQAVTITGINFSGATAVNFGGVPASLFTVNNDNTITAIVSPAGASGNVSVTTPNGARAMAGFTFLQPPVITSFTPASAAAGTTVIITGSNFTGATAVSFGGMAAASFYVINAGTITAVVPASGASGQVKVTTAAGTGTKTGFTFLTCTPVKVTAGITADAGPAICGGTAVSFTAKVLNGGTPVYQWYKNNLPVGTSSNKYKDAALNNSDSVWCVVTSTLGCVITNPVKTNVMVFAVTPRLVPTLTLASSAGLGFCQNTTVTVTANTTNTGASPVYQWKKNGIVVGTNSSTYTDSTYKSNDQLTCVLTASQACVIPASITVKPLAFKVNPIMVPAVTITPDIAGAVCAGTRINFTAVAVNGGKSSYKWYRNGAPGGGTTTYTNGGLKDGDSVWCITTNAGTCLATPTARSNVYVYKTFGKTPPTLTITSNAAAGVCPGAPVAFMAGTTDSITNPQYVWKRNNVTAGSNMATYIDSVPQNGDSISCTLTETLPCAAGQAVSYAAVMLNFTNTAIAVKPAAISGPGTVTANQAGLIFKTTAVSGVTYNWTEPAGATIVSGQGTYKVTVNWGSTAGSLTVTASNRCGTSAATIRNVSMAAGLKLDADNTDVSSSLAGSTIRVYPNPVTSTATIEFTAATVNKYEAQVMNAVGQLVTSKAGMTVKGLNTVKFEMANLASAIYYVRLIDAEHGIRIIKLVKAK